MKSFGEDKTVVFCSSKFWQYLEYLTMQENQTVPSSPLHWGSKIPIDQNWVASSKLQVNIVSLYLFMKSAVYISDL